MDQKKTGKLITQCRKEKGLTQAKLAEQLSVSEQAVSKWETGRSLPDPSLMLELCGVLGITVNELLRGERINVEDYQDQAEQQFVEIQKEKTRSRKKGILRTVLLLLAVLLIPMPESYKDGGTKSYTALTYKIVKWNRLGEFGEEDFVKNSFYLFPKNFYFLDKLYEMERSGEPEKIGYGGEPEPFLHFVLSLGDTGAEREVFEASKTEEGALLEHYYSYRFWDAEKNESVERRRMVRSLSDSWLYESLCGLLGDCRVRMWDGCTGGNSDEILDRISMEFTAELADGTGVSASGIDIYSNNCRFMAKAMRDWTTMDYIASPQLCTGKLEITLPESWMEWISAEITPDYVAFHVPEKDGAPLTFLVIDTSLRDYYPAGPETNPVRIGRLNGPDFEEYVQVRDGISLKENKELLIEEVQWLADSFEADRQYIIDSLQGMGDYTLVPAE